MDTKTAQSVDSLGARAANIAMRAAVDRILTLGLKDSIDIDKVCAALKRIAPGASLRALDDAREAYALGMHQVGEATFAATMMAAGIEAVNEVIAEAA